MQSFSLLQTLSRVDVTLKFQQPFCYQLETEANATRWQSRDTDGKNPGSR